MFCPAAQIAVYGKLQSFATVFELAHSLAWVGRVSELKRGDPGLPFIAKSESLAQSTGGHEKLRPVGCVGVIWRMH